MLKRKVIANFLRFAELYGEDVRRTIEGFRRARSESRRFGRPLPSGGG